MRLNKIITGLMVTSFMLVAEPQQQMAQALAAYQQGNHTLAAEIYQTLALEGNVKAQFELAKLYSMGQGVAQDALQAAYWLEQAASNSPDYAESARAQQDIHNALLQQRNAASSEAATQTAVAASVPASQIAEPEQEPEPEPEPEPVRAQIAAAVSPGKTVTATREQVSAVPELAVKALTDASFAVGMRAFERYFNGFASCCWCGCVGMEPSPALY